MINTLFAEEMVEGWLTVYMDDMAIHTGRRPEETEEEHRQRHQKLVKRVLTKLQQHNLFLKPEKCVFEQPHIEFLGITLKDQKVHMEEGKVAKVAQWE